MTCFFFAGCGGADLLARGLRLARVHPQQPTPRGDPGARAARDPLDRGICLAHTTQNQLPQPLGSGARLWLMERQRGPVCTEVIHSSRKVVCVVCLGRVASKISIS